MTLAMILLVSTMSFTFLGASTSSIVNPFGQWISQHKSLFLLFHSLIAAAIYFVFGVKIDTLAKQREISPEMVTQLKQSRLYLIGAVALLDVFFFYLMG